MAAPSAGARVAARPYASVVAPAAPAIGRDEWELVQRGREPAAATAAAAVPAGAASAAAPRGPPRQPRAAGGKKQASAKQQPKSQQRHGMELSDLIDFRALSAAAAPPRAPERPLAGASARAPAALAPAPARPAASEATYRAAATLAASRQARMVSRLVAPAPVQLEKLPSRADPRQNPNSLDPRQAPAVSPAFEKKGKEKRTKPRKPTALKRLILRDRLEQWIRGAILAPILDAVTGAPSKRRRRRGGVRTHSPEEDSPAPPPQPALSDTEWPAVAAAERAEPVALAAERALGPPPPPPPLPPPQLEHGPPASARSPAHPLVVADAPGPRPPAVSRGSERPSGADRLLAAAVRSLRGASWADRATAAREAPQPVPVSQPTAPAPQPVAPSAQVAAPPAPAPASGLWAALLRPDAGPAVRAPPPPPPPPPPPAASVPPPPPLPPPPPAALPSEVPARPKRVPQNSEAKGVLAASSAAAAAAASADAEADAPMTLSVLRDKMHPRPPGFQQAYAAQELSPHIDELADSVITELVKLQHRMAEKNPLKAKMKRRLLCGLREATKALRAGTVKGLVVAPNIEQAGGEEGLPAATAELLSLCAQHDVPVVFALSRRRLAAAAKRSHAVSAVALLDVDGAHEPFRTMVALAREARERAEMFAADSLLNGETDLRLLAQRARDAARSRRAEMAPQNARPASKLNAHAALFQPSWLQ